jgi:cyclic dehypoxanthinyl futalosine synthase
VHHLTLEQIRSAISELGWIPRRRNVFYDVFVDEPPSGSSTARGAALPVLATVP